MNITTGKIMSAQKVVLYGPEGVGKTGLATLFPNPIFIDTEGSTKHYDVARTDAPTSWPMFLDQVKYLIEQPHNYSTLVIDTIDWLEKLCSAHVCAVGGEHGPVKGIEDFGWGKGYKYLEEEFSRMLNMLSYLCDNRSVNILLLAHTHLRQINLPEENGQFDKYELKLHRKVAPLPKEWADAVLFANYKTLISTDPNNKTKATGGRRTLFTSNHPAYEAKCRFQGVPKTIDYQDAPEKAWSAIAPYIPVRAEKVKSAPIVDQPTTAPSPSEANEALEDVPINTSFAPQLWDLMEQSLISAEQIETFAYNNNHLSEGTKLDDFPTDYCDMLVTRWEEVKKSLLK